MAERQRRRISSFIAMFLLLSGLVLGVARWVVSGDQLGGSLVATVVHGDATVAIKLMNRSFAPVRLETLPDRSYQGSACQDSVFYRAVLERWDSAEGRWGFVRELNPLDTLKQDKVSASNTTNKYLWPGGGDRKSVV